MPPELSPELLLPIHAKTFDRPSGTPSSAKHPAQQQTNPKGNTHGQQWSLPYRRLNLRPERAVQLIQQLFQLLFQGIKAVGPVTTAITGTVEKLLQLLAHSLRRETCIGFNQTNKLVHTPPGCLEGVMGQIRPALLDRGQQAVEPLPEVVLESAVGLRRWRGHKDRWQDALEE